MSEALTNLTQERATVAARRDVARRRRKLLRTLPIQALLIVGSIASALPLLWMVITSVKADRQLFVSPPVWIPNPIIWANYPAVFDYAPFLHYLRNTLYIAVPNVLGPVITCSLAAYAFARIPATGRNLIFMIMLSTIMVPSVVTLVPLFVIFSKLGFVNTFLPLVLPPLLGNPFYIFLLRQFFMTLPVELEESALLDGASYLRIWWSVILPLSKPALATVGVFGFLSAWNDFLGPLIYLNNTDMYTLALGLRTFQTEHGAKWGLLMAASTMMVAPIVVLFFVAQRQFVQGIALTGLKG